MVLSNRRSSGAAQCKGIVFVSRLQEADDGDGGNEPTNDDRDESDARRMAAEPPLPYPDDSGSDYDPEGGEDEVDPLALIPPRAPRSPRPSRIRKPTSRRPQ